MIANMVRAFLTWEILLFAVTAATADTENGITVTFNQSTYSVNEGDGPAQPVLVLSNPSSTDITVQMSSIDGLATGGGIDYDSGPYTVIFPAGVTRIPFDIQINDDTILEDDEEFSLTINPSDDHYFVGDWGGATVSILDDDSITISFNQSTYIVDEGTGPAQPVLVLSNPSSTDIIVLVSSTDGSATGGVDYNSGGPYIVTIPAGENDVTFNVTIIDDNIREMSEIFNLIIDPSSLPNGITSSNNVTVTILDHDELTMKFSQPTYTSSESSGSAPITLLLEGGTSDSDISVTVIPSDQSPLSAEGNGVDYNSIPITATFTAGTTSTTINIPVTEDNIVEGNERFDLSFDIPSTLQRVVMGDGSVVTCIIEDSTTYTISFDQPMYSVNEDVRQVSITLTHTNQSSIDIIVQIDSRHIHARNQDYVTGPYQIAFPANQSKTIFNINIWEDDIVEIDEIFNLTITTAMPTGMTPGRFDHTTVTIIDNDMTTVSFMASSYSTGERKNVKPSIVFSNPSSVDFMIFINSTDMTATGGKDYISGPYNVRIHGKDPVEFTVNIINDNIFEINEQFRLDIVSVSLPEKVSISEQNYQTIVTIRDDDDNKVEFGQSEYSVAESNRRVKPVLVFTNPSSIDVTIVIRSIDNSAAGGEDYGTGPYNVTLPHGETRVSFGVPIFEDDIKEDPETFTLSIVSELLPSRISIRNLNSVTVFINDTTGKPKVEFNQSDYFVSESSGSVTIALLLSGSISDDEITVTVTPFDLSSAQGRKDYTIRPVTASFSANINTIQLSVNIKTDGIVEEIETFGLRLSVPPELSLSSITRATVHIIDSTMSNVSFNQLTYSVYENSGPVHLILVLTNPSSTDINVTVHLHNTDSNATVGSDFTTGPYHVNFPAMSTSTSLTISIKDDDILEGNEIFGLVIVEHLLPNNININLGSTGSATVTIVDTTVIATITKDPIDLTTVYEGTTVTLSCEATASGPITYQWRRSNGAITGDRFNGVNTPTLTIPSVTQDDEDEYYCTASYGVYVNGTSHVAESEIAKVVVFGPPVVRPFDSVYYAIAGQSFTFNCSAMNDVDSPINLTFDWLKDNNLINENMAQVKVVDSTTSQLFIPQLDPDQHSGQYSCGVYNNEVSDAVNTSTRLIIEVADFTKLVASAVESFTINGTSYAVNIRFVLPNFYSDPISHWVVVVTTDANVIASQIPDSKLISYSESIGHTMYVAVVMDNTIEDQWEKTVILGNGNTSTWNGKTYYNAPLSKGVSYYVFIRAYAASHVDSNPRYTSSTLSLLTSAGKNQLDDSCNCECDNHIVGIAIVTVLLVVAIACIVGLVIWNVQLNKKIIHFQAPKQDSAPQIANEPAYELIDKSSDVNMEKIPAYSTNGVQENSVDHHYESIPVNNRYTKANN